MSDEKLKPVLRHDNTNQNHDRHINWDEHAIEEHDQLRGTRMKIDEPKTPYHSDEGGVDPAELSNKLNSMAESSEDEKKKHDRFLAMRKAHYEQEMQKAKELSSRNLSVDDYPDE